MQDLEQKSYARCKGCDQSFYPAWREHRQAFEELCPTCIMAAYGLVGSEDSDFVKGYLMDKDLTLDIPMGVDYED